MQQRFEFIENPMNGTIVPLKQQTQYKIGSVAAADDYLVGLKWIQPQSRR